MDFVTKQDINAPAEFVFAQLIDFDFFESFAMRIGAQVSRQDKFTVPQIGMCWQVSGKIRGKQREVDVTLDSYQPTDSLSYQCSSNALDATISMETIPLSRTETRLKVTVGVQPKGLSARLALQSAKLAKRSLDRKFDNRMREFANKISEKYRGNA